MKTMDLKVRSIRHHLEGRVRDHVLLCMLSYYLEWHMRQRLELMLFDECDPEAAEAMWSSMVAKAQRSPSENKKANTKRTSDKLPVHSFQIMLKDLATLRKNLVQFQDDDQTTTFKLADETPLQQKAFKLLGVRLSL